MTCNECNHGFIEFSFDIFGCLLLRSPANFPDKNYPSCLRILLESFQMIDKGGAHDGVPPNTNTCGLAKTSPGQLIHHFISQGTTPRNHCHITGSVNGAWHNSDFGLLRRDNSRAIGANKDRVFTFQKPGHFDHIQYGNPLGNTHNDLETRRHCINYCITRKGWWDKDTGRIYPFLLHSLLDSIENRHALNLLATFTGCNPRSYCCSVVKHLFCMKGTFTTSNTLYNHPGIFIH